MRKGGTEAMTYSSVPWADEYLPAIESIGSFESVAEFFAPDATFQEFPNLIAPYGRVRHAVAARAAYDLGRQTLKSQTDRVRGVLEAGDELAVRLDWSPGCRCDGIGPGHRNEGVRRDVLTFRDGKIVAQRDFDGYPPSESQANPAV
jgi:ketosteroid isomerase-like protein